MQPWCSGCSAEPSRVEEAGLLRQVGAGAGPGREYKEIEEKGWGHLARRDSGLIEAIVVLERVADKGQPPAAKDLFPIKILKKLVKTTQNNVWNAVRDGRGPCRK